MWTSEGKAVTAQGTASTKAQTWSIFGSKQASGASAGRWPPGAVVPDQGRLQIIKRTCPPRGHWKVSGKQHDQSKRTGGKGQWRKLRDQGGGHCNNPARRDGGFSSGSSSGSGDNYSGSGPMTKGKRHFVQGSDLSV